MERFNVFFFLFLKTATPINPPEGIGKLSGRTKMMMLNEDGVLCAIEETRAMNISYSQGTPSKQLRQDMGSTSSGTLSQNSSTPPPSRPSSSASVSPPETAGDNSWAYFKNIKPLYKLKVQNIMLMMQMHLSGLIKDDDQVSKRSVSF
jgi:hypothetical protein